MAQEIGLIGLAVVGENLALNVERNGFPIAVYNRTFEKTEGFVNGRAKGKNVVGAKTVPEFVGALSRPRRILTMVKAGKPVDDLIAELRPHLESGDIVIDGGNSHYADTDRRMAALEPTGIRFVGMGVSGGEEGALNGPSLMPGGEKLGYERLEPILTKIAAKTDSGACVTYVGAKSSGHFVKTVHNGIEYGDMQLIGEAYDLMRNGLGLEPSELADVFAEWNAGELQSFLIDVTAKIVDFPDDLGSRKILIDQILDKAAQKGTGKWTGQVALDLGVPIPTIGAAVDARLVSAERGLRQEAARKYRGRGKPGRASRKKAIGQIRSGLYASKICSYAQGFELMRQASKQFGYGLRLGELARIWKGGCIIRAVFLDRIREAFDRNPDLPNLLLDDNFAREIKKRVEDWRETVMLGIRLGITTPAMAASLAYFDSLRRSRLPANLVAAQRDFFGAHTYERIDREGVFHTQWQRPEGRAGAGDGKARSRR